MNNKTKTSIAGFISLVLSLQPTAGLAVMGSSMASSTAETATGSTSNIQYSLALGTLNLSHKRFLPNSVDTQAHKIIHNIVAG